MTITIMLPVSRKPNLVKLEWIEGKKYFLKDIKRNFVFDVVNDFNSKISFDFNSKTIKETKYSESCGFCVENAKEVFKWVIMTKQWIEIINV